MELLRYFVLLYYFFMTSFSFAEDYYKLLGVERNADQRDIRKAFKRIAITEHPDKNSDDPQAHEKFVKLTTAYETLKDPDLRKKYDLYGEEGLDRGKRHSNYHSYTYYKNNFGIYDDDPEILTLNNNDFFENVLDSEKMWMINFYSPMCSHCHHLAPIWRKVAKDLEGVIRIGAVNCEDDWALCNQVGIRSYPTLLHYSKKNTRGIEYKGAKTYEAIVRYVFDQLDARINEIDKPTWKGLLGKKSESDKPVLVFVCGESRNCFDSDDRLKVAAIFDKIVDVRVFNCKRNDECGSMFNSTGLILLSPTEDKNFKPTVLDNISEVDELVERILEELPEPQDIDEETFEEILRESKKGSSEGWLICFYLSHATDFDVLLKQLPGVLRGVNLAKINCARHSTLCERFRINHYPAWIVFKPGGAYELKHGKNSLNDVANFAKSSLKAPNVWLLSEDKIELIMQRRSDEAWFIDWYSPLCPPCLKFLPEVRKASLELRNSEVRFGLVDCTAYPAACRKYNIRVYPTAMLVNGTNLSEFKMQKTASNVVEFIKECKNPSVFQLNSKNFYQFSKKKVKELWVVDFFASWCGPCQMLAPQWTMVAKALKLLPFVKVASLDCEFESDLCQTQGIRSYPTIRLYPLQSDGLNSVAMYQGERDQNSILRWISYFLPHKVLELDHRNLDAEVLKTNKIVLVDYYAPWCGHCVELEPHFTIAAQLMKKKVIFARLNCDRYRDECDRADVRAYPSMRLYSEKKTSRVLNRGRKVKGANAETIIKELESLLPKKTSHDEL